MKLIVTANLRTESGPILEKIVAFMKGNPAAKVVIEGDTDNVGDAAGNQRLSEQRATSVVGAKNRRVTLRLMK